MKKILVTGAKGQLGTELNFLSSLLETHTFTFVGHQDLDITEEEAVKRFLGEGKFDVVVNCAAYTAVDKAETEEELAYKINDTGVANIASACSDNGTKLIQIGSDFVFEGMTPVPYGESDYTNPIQVYGRSKLQGDLQAYRYLQDAIVIRTSWVYSSFGHNFVKTILRLCKERDSIGVVYDQTGSPTYARDLADVILKIIQHPEWKSNIYNYSNEGVASWYDLATAVRDYAGLKTKIRPILTDEYPTAAMRPAYSVLNKAKIKETFGIEIPHWTHSLKNCMALLS